MTLEQIEAAKALAWKHIGGLDDRAEQLAQAVLDLAAEVERLRNLEKRKGYEWKSV